MDGEVRQMATSSFIMTHFIDREKILWLEKGRQNPLFRLRDDDTGVDLRPCFAISHKDCEIVLRLLIMGVKKKMSFATPHQT